MLLLGIVLTDFVSCRCTSQQFTFSPYPSNFLVLYTPSLFSQDIYSYNCSQAGRKATGAGEERRGFEGKLFNIQSSLSKTFPGNSQPDAAEFCESQKVGLLACKMGAKVASPMLFFLKFTSVKGEAVVCI